MTPEKLTSEHYERPNMNLASEILMVDFIGPLIRYFTSYFDMPGRDVFQHGSPIL